MKIKITSFLILIFLIFIAVPHVTAQKSVLFVTVNTQPENAEISIDGKRVERVNNMIELAKGDYTILIESLGYFSYESTITVTRKKTVFSFALTEDPSIVIPPQVIIEEPIEDSVVDESIPIIVESDTKISQDPVPIKSDYSFEIEMVKIKGGEYLMGRDGNTGDHKIHEVKVDDFTIGKYEITQEQWVSVMGSNPSKYVNDKNPVDNVSYLDVMEFIEKLNSMTGKQYRLPTEAEWEYAARGGVNGNNYTDTKYSGSSKIDEVAWYWRDSGDTILSGRWDNESLKHNHCHTQEVGLKKPNSLDIYDMTGNVWEWCSDWYSKDYYESSPKLNPQGPNHDLTRVYRGGAFVSKVKYCYVYFRFSGKPEYGYNYIGFRLVL